MENKYLIVGFGRLGRHLNRYLDLLKIPTRVATRATPLEECVRLAQTSERILLCVPDRHIAEVAKAWKSYNPNATLLHFSGALVLDDVASAHPLAAFSTRELSLDEYRNIFFAVAPGVSFSSLLPGLPNRSFELPVELRPAYHALCVLLGNGTTTLWEKSQIPGLSIPSEVLVSYLENITANLKQGLSEGQSVLTGPWVRGDHVTTQKHLQVLKDSPLTSIYTALRELAGSVK